MDNELKTILESVKSEVLTEEVKAQIATLVEAKVSEKVNAKVDELDKIYEEFKTAEVTKLEEKAVEFVDTELVGKIDEYMEYVAEEYLKENELAIEDGLKAQQYETLLEGLRNLLAENKISEKTAVEGESVFQENKSLKGEVNEIMKENLELKKEIKGLKAISVFNEIASDLTESDKEKLKTLCEDFDIDDLTEFSKKVGYIKESLRAFDAKEVTPEVVAPVQTEAQVIAESVEVVEPTIKLEEPVANNSSILDGMWKHIK